MDDKVNYSLVGVFVLALGAALVAGVLWLAAGLGGQQAMNTYQAVIKESVAGLNVDAPVKYLGVDVARSAASRSTRTTRSRCGCTSSSTAARRSSRTAWRC
jgi:hypothetical protein